VEGGYLLDESLFHGNSSWGLLGAVLEVLRNALSKACPDSIKRPLKRLFGLPETRLHPSWSILLPFGPAVGRHVILDVGSHSGWFFHCWKDWCPDAVVHAFEPSKEAFDNSMRQYGGDPDITINRLGLAETSGTRKFYVLSESRVSNSVLPPQQDIWNSIEYKTGQIEEREIVVDTLDKYCSTHDLKDIYLVKIDVQGLELEVLKGGEDTLRNVRHVFVESGIQPLYEGAPTFADVFEFLGARGFHLAAFRSWHRGNHVLIETDMLFRRNDLAPPVDNTIVRVVEQAV